MEARLSGLVQEPGRGFDEVKRLPFEGDVCLRLTPLFEVQQNYCYSAAASSLTSILRN